MKILLAFTPFLLFVIVQRLMGVTAGLMSAAVGSAALLAYNLISRKQTAKVLEVGTVILFGVLAFGACLSKATWPIAGIRLCVDAGLLLIALVSMAIRQPFTLQYAREQVSQDLWDRPEFFRVNYVITAAWAFAFATIVAADLIMLAKPELPAHVGILASIVGMAGAAGFTSWYPAMKMRLHSAGSR